MKEKDSNLWDLLAKRTDHSLSREEEEELRQLLQEDASLRRASQLVDESRVELDNSLVEETMNRTWSKIEIGMKKEKSHRLALIIRRCLIAACIAVNYARDGGGQWRQDIGIQRKSFVERLPD